MGDTTSSTLRSDNEGMDQYLRKLQFVQNMENPHFGSIEVFRMKEPPYEYIMDYKKTFMEGDNRFLKYINCMNQLAKT